MPDTACQDTAPVPQIFSSCPAFQQVTHQLPYTSHHHQGFHIRSVPMLHSIAHANYSRVCLWAHTLPVITNRGIQ